MLSCIFDVGVLPEKFGGTEFGKAPFPSLPGRNRIINTPATPFFRLARRQFVHYRKPLTGDSSVLSCSAAVQEAFPGAANGQLSRSVSQTVRRVPYSSNVQIPAFH